MKPVHALVLCASFAAAGCDEGVDLGHPPPVLVQGDRRVVALGGASRDRLQREIAILADGEPQAVHAVIVTRSAASAASTRRLLIRLGLDPVRIVEAPTRGGSGEVVLTRAVALTAPCASAIEPAAFGNPGRSLNSLADCTQANNLAQMVVDPADLVAPPRLGPGDGAYLTAGVEKWRSSVRSESGSQRQNGNTATNFSGSTGDSATSPQSTTTMP